MPRLRSTIPRLINPTTVLIFICLIGFGNQREAQGQTPAAGDVVFSQIYTGGGNRINV